MEILIGVGLLVLSGVGTFFYMQSQDNFDVLSDYKEIKAAYKAFRNESIGLTKGIANIKKYLSEDSKVNLDNYEITVDDKYLIVKKVPKDTDPNLVAKQVGGSSSFKSGRLKLSFFTMGTGVEPEAIIKVQPMNNITTTTRLEYSHEDSTAEDSKILEVEWENNNEYFNTEGVHTVKLRIMDKHYRWSEWVKKDIFVTEIKGIKSIHGGGGHLAVCHNNGDIYAYGENSFGQLGNCTNIVNEMLDKIVQLEKVVDVALGDNHSLFLKADKKVFATGKNDFGQLGVGSRTNSKIPKLSWGLENVVDIACGHGFSAAVTMDGHVYTWGINENHSLGHNDVHFGDRPMKLTGLENIKSVTLGYDFGLALGFDGNVTGWGNNDYGQLALGYKSKMSDPQMTQLKDIKQLAAGKNFVMALTNQGRVMGCGINKRHQLGFDGEKEILFPMEIGGLKDIEKILCSNDFIVALDAVGNVYTWGQYSPVDNDYAMKPMKSDDLKYIKDIAVTNNHGYALTEEGVIYQFSSKFTQVMKVEVVQYED